MGVTLLVESAAGNYFAIKVSSEAETLAKRGLGFRLDKSTIARIELGIVALVGVM